MVETSGLENRHGESHREFESHRLRQEMKSMNKEDLIERLKDRGIKEEILKAIQIIDRKNFVSENNLEEAYEDHPLSIGYGQTISQPYTVAFMLQELELKKGDRILEIGTGSGWNAALMSYLVGENGEIYSVEVIKELAEKAKEILGDYKNVFVFNMDGSRGLAQYAPYDKIILTAAPKQMPEEIKKQLGDGGILLAPVGEYMQKLVKITRKKDRFTETGKGDFIFVPLVNKSQ